MGGKVRRAARAFAAAFSMYSRIPMPQFAWEDEDLAYMMAFFPLVGLAEGAAVCAWEALAAWLGVGELCRVLIGAAIMLYLSGGIHLDGFLDTMDAFSSCRPREKKLEILKDPHIGAFSVLRLSLYGLVFLGAYSEIRGRGPVLIFCAGFVLARCLGAIGLVGFPLAKEEGLAYRFASRARKRPVLALLMLQALGCACLMILQSPWAGSAAILASLAAFGLYYVRCRRELGGITGDTSGYFICVCECVIAVAAAACRLLPAAVPGLMPLR